MPSRWRHGSPWRDADVWQIFIVSAFATTLSLGTLYLWCLWRTSRVAWTAPCDSDEVGTLVVFGKRLVNGKPDEEFRWRLRRTLRLLRRHSQLRAVITGGMAQARDQSSESEAGRAWLLMHAPELAPRLMIEDQSGDTIDNLRETRQVLTPGTIFLLSNRYHLARCQLLARHLGMDVRLCAAEPRPRINRRLVGRVLLEAGYRLLFVVGRRWAHLTGHQRMLSRIN